MCNGFQLSIDMPLLACALYTNLSHMIIQYL